MWSASLVKVSEIGYEVSEALCCFMGVYSNLLGTKRRAVSGETLLARWLHEPVPYEIQYKDAHFILLKG
jgi:hypothetical protein